MLAKERSGTALADHVPSLIVNQKDFEYSKTPPVAGMTAFLATDWRHGLLFAQPIQAQCRRRGFAYFGRLFTGWAKTPNEPLGDDDAN